MSQIQTHPITEEFVDWARTQLKPDETFELLSLARCRALAAQWACKKSEDHTCAEPNPDTE